MNKKMMEIEGDMFRNMRTDANIVLNDLLETMSARGAKTGEMTIKISISKISEFIEDEKGYAREAEKLGIKHKVTSKVEKKESQQGQQYCDTEELVYDEEHGRYMVVPIRHAAQMNINDYMEEQDGETDKEE